MPSAGHHLPVLHAGPDHQAVPGEAQEGDQPDHQQPAAMISSSPPFGTAAPRISVTCRVQSGRGNGRASAPQVACNSATPASDRPTVTSTCSMVPGRAGGSAPARPAATTSAPAATPKATASRTPSLALARQVARRPPGRVGADTEEQPVREVEHVGQAEDQ